MRSLFDPLPAEAQRDAAISAAQEANPREVDLARAIAAELALAGDGTCYADRVARIFEALGLEWKSGWTGGLFRTNEWEHTGQHVKSTRRSNHARIQWVFRYSGRQDSDSTRRLIQLARQQEGERNGER